MTKEEQKEQVLAMLDLAAEHWEENPPPPPPPAAAAMARKYVQLPTPVRRARS